MINFHGTSEQAGRGVFQAMMPPSFAEPPKMRKTKGSETIVQERQANHRHARLILVSIPD
jgi:hypothetical protein